MSRQRISGLSSAGAWDSIWHTHIFCAFPTVSDSPSPSPETPLPSLTARIVPWRQACAHTHMFTFVLLETRHVLILRMFSFVLFTFAPRMSEAASTIICGHRLYWLIGGLWEVNTEAVFSLLVPCGMVETTIQHLPSTTVRSRVTPVSLMWTKPDGNGMYVCMSVRGHQLYAAN